MDLKQKILDNIRKQVNLQEQLDKLQREGDNLSAQVNRLGGQMELLTEILSEEQGMSLNDYIEQDVDFKKAIQDIQRSESVQLEDQVEAIEYPSSKLHSGNKTVEKNSSRQEIPTVTRTRQPPKIVVTDDPVIPDEDDD